MANGIQRTPLDFTDLGGQLLHALVAAEETKGQRERIKLMEKEMGLREREQQISLANQLSPEAAANVLSGLFPGQSFTPESIRVRPEEAEFTQKMRFFEQNPARRERYFKLQSGGLLDERQALEAEEIAHGLRLSAADRANVVGGLLDRYGSPMAPVWNAAFGREMGVRLGNEQTLAEQSLGVQKTEAEARLKALKASQADAQQRAYEFIAGGFQPVPGSEAARDPERRRRLTQEVLDYARGISDFISPEASAEIVPTQTWARILHESAQLSPLTQAKIDMTKFLGAQVEKLGDDAPQETVDLLQRYLVEIDQELHPQEQGEPEAAPASAKPDSGVSAAIGTALTGRPFTAAANLLERLMGRPLKAKLRGLLEAAAPLIEPGAESNLMFKALDGAVKKLGDILGGPIPPPAQTVGPIADPALSIPDDARSKLLQLVSAYKAVGAEPDEMRELEEALRTVVQQGDPEAIKEMFDAVVVEIDARKKAQR